MKKIYSFLTMAVMALVMSFTAQATFTVKMKVDDATRMTATLQYNDANYNYVTEELDMSKFTGEGGEFTVGGDYAYLYVYATDGNIITYAMDEGTGSASDTGSSTYFFLYTGTTLSLKSANMAEARSASCTINVDKTDNIGGLKMNSTNERVNLQAGENTVKFMPDVESPFELSAVYGKDFYKVTVDGQSVAKQYGVWYLNVKDGSVVDILTEYPDQEVSVAVAYASEDGIGAVKAVKVDGEEVALDADGKVNVKLGKKVTVTLDKSNYAFSSFTINGTTPSDYYSSTTDYSFVVKEETTVLVDAHKYGTISVTVKVEHPECVMVYDQSSTLLNLVPGDNVIELSENGARLSVSKAAGCKISSILVNGKEHSNYGYDYSTSIYISEPNTVIEIFANELVYDNTAIVNVIGDFYQYSSVTNLTLYEYTYLTAGENNVKFNNGEEKHRLYIMTPNYGNPAGIYFNGIYMGNNSSNEITLANGDYITVYMNEDLGKSVSIDAQAKYVDDVTVKVNGVEYEDWANGLKVLDGTKVAVELANGSTGVVYVNGAAKTGEFEVTAHTTVFVGAASATVSPVAGTANPYAYALKSEVAEGCLKLSYALNANATAVNINIKNANGEVVETIAGETAKGAHAATVALGEYALGNYTWEVVVEGAAKSSVEHFGNYSFWHPRGVEVDNSMESESFGNVYVTEGQYTSSTSYWSGKGGGLGLYAFDAAFNPIKNETTGKYAFTGGWTLHQKAGSTNAADFCRVRVAEDGRIFLTRLNDKGDYILYANNFEELAANDKLNSLFTGLTFDASTYKYTNANGDYMGGANTGFAVKGSGEDLKLLSISSFSNHWAFVYSGASCDEYALGTAATLPVPTQVAALTGRYTIAPLSTNVDYDNRGGIWYCQYRGTPTAEQPALVYVDANGEEKYVDLVSRGGGGIRMSPDYKQIAIASSSVNPKQFTIYNIVWNASGEPTLLPELVITHGIGTNVNDIAWDLAGNIYAVSNSGELVRGYALPRNEAFTTKAAAKYAFEVTDEVTAIEKVEVEEAAVEYYNLQGVKVANPEKGIFIRKQGNKTTKVIL